jgi:adenosylcobyric acid synthase
VRQTEARFNNLQSPWQALAHGVATGYEIRHGRTEAVASAGQVQVALLNGEGEPIGWQAGPVLGLYLHGLFENPMLLRKLFGQSTRPLDAVFDGLADFIDTHLDTHALLALLDP